MADVFGTYLKKLRKSKGLTLKQVEQSAQVSNAYVSLVERGLRNPPHPDILTRLAKIYGVSNRELLIQAGYLKEEGSELRKRRNIQDAFDHVTSDPEYQHGTRLKGATLNLEAKRFIVEMYEKATGRKLLEVN